MPDSNHQAKLSELSTAERALIERYLDFYEQVEHGKMELENEERRHFQTVARGLAAPETEHEKAYLAYKAAAAAPLPTPSIKSSTEAKNEGILESLKATLDKELFNIAKRRDLTEEEKVAKIINKFSIVCAAVAIQPLPFADIMILTPIQVGMAERLASIRGIKVPESGAKDILIEVGKVVGLGLLAQQAAIGLYKTILPGLGGLMSIPLVYGLTYGIGRALDYNYVQMRKGRKASKEELKRIFEEAKAEGRKVSKQHNNEIQEVNDGIQ